MWRVWRTIVGFYHSTHTHPHAAARQPLTGSTRSSDTSCPHFPCSLFLLTYLSIYQLPPPGASLTSSNKSYAGSRSGEFVERPIYTIGTTRGTHNYMDRPSITSTAPLLQRVQETNMRLAWNSGTEPSLASTFLGTFSASSTPGSAFTLATRVQLKLGEDGNIQQISSIAGAPLLTPMVDPHAVRLSWL